MSGLSFVDHQDVILSEVDHQATRLACRHALPNHELDDVRQDLITDVIARSPAFDDARASPSTFVAMVAANRAALLGRRYYRQQCLYGRSPVSLDEPIGDDDGAPVTRGDLVAEADGYAAWMGHASDPFRETERRLDLRAAAQLLPDRLRGLCDALTGDTASGASRSQNRSRAEIYRCLREVRLRFRAAGLASPA
jgi:DNA-directed RNA polymerase specialized sigma24 family protein